MKLRLERHARYLGTGGGGFHHVRQEREKAPEPTWWSSHLTYKPLHQAMDATNEEGQPREASAPSLRCLTLQQLAGTGLEVRIGVLSTPIE
jgi:hypothetical protein